MSTIKYPLPCRLTPSNIETKCKNCRREPGCDVADATAATNNDSIINDSRSKVETKSQPENFSRANDERSNAANTHTKDRCIIDRLDGLVLNESYSDVIFQVATKPTPLSDSEAETSEHQYERIPAHKLILSISSAVFKAMFFGAGSQMEAVSNTVAAATGGSNEKSTSTTTTIRITDVDAATFKSMLRYIYTDDLEAIGPDSVMGLLYCAKKYAVTSLERKCVEFLNCNLRADNAFMLLEQALMFDEPELVDACECVIDKSGDEAFASDAFLECSGSTLERVVKRDSLAIREFNLFEHLLKWAEAKCVKQSILQVSRESKRTMLDSIIKHIRFPLMTREEFALAMRDPESRIIDDTEIVDLFVHLTLASINNSNNPNTTASSNADSTQINPTASSSTELVLQPIKYSSKPRCCLSGPEEVVNRFTRAESRWGYSGTPDRVRFSVDRRIFIVGFGLYGSIYGKYEYSVSIQLIHFDSSTVCAQNTTSFMCDGSNSTFRALFKEPVEVLPDVEYVASANLKGPDSFYGTKGQRRVIHESHNNHHGKVTFTFQYASGNNNGTSVEDGQIPEILFIYSSC